MNIDGVDIPNITCPKCKFRHPEQFTCAEAKALAEAARPEPQDSPGSNPHGLTDAAQRAVRCALLDLIGAYQDWKLKGCPDSSHDWQSHLSSIDELAAEFDMQEDIPENQHERTNQGGR